ncbi:hypothetical protein FBU30_007751 [Linnemannia zychae]|nr:hypothetical protein FBU30_007751 [Linnemannia zychae]
MAHKGSEQISKATSGTPDHPLPSYAYHQLAAGATTAGTAANAAALLAATAQGGGLYRSISTGSAADLNTAAFTNPGPPPQPPTLGATSSSARTGRGRSRSDTGRKTYNQPIHIRPPGPTFQPHQQQRPPSEGVERGSGLYGYM